MKKEVLSLIETRDAGNPIKSKQIEKSLGITGAEVRKYVMKLRRKGNRIGSGYQGYFLAKTHDEFVDVMSHMQSRIDSEMKTLHQSIKRSKKKARKQSKEG